MGRKVRDEENNHLYEEDYDPIIGSTYSEFPQSVFWTIRFVLIACLVMGFPFVLFWFGESILGYLLIVFLFSINEVICRVFGWHKIK